MVRGDPETRLVWLRVSIDEALRRAERDEVERPLLAGADRMEQATRLLAEREPLYASADHVIDVDGRQADAVVDDIVEWLKTNIS
jgi:shikimate kinase